MEAEWAEGKDQLPRGPRIGSVLEPECPETCIVLIAPWTSYGCELVQ